jgi:DNA-binding MarR family transcriptional regulator
MVDKLEAKGLIVRQASEEDRRAQVLHVTAKGADLVRKATHKIVEAESALLPLSPANRRSSPSCCTRWRWRARAP